MGDSDGSLSDSEPEIDDDLCESLLAQYETDGEVDEDEKNNPSREQKAGKTGKANKAQLAHHQVKKVIDTMESLLSGGGKQLCTS